jgi:hypothetical protein
MIDPGIDWASVLAFWNIADGTIVKDSNLEVIGR